MAAKKTHQYLNLNVAKTLNTTAPHTEDFELIEADVLFTNDVVENKEQVCDNLHSAREHLRKNNDVDRFSVGPKSVPMNILGAEYRKRATEDEQNDRLPPHEYLTRTRGASLSVHEGVGRTLKGRDLRRVRNAVWKKFGFED